MKWYSFSEVVTDATSKFKKIKASDYQTTGKYKIIDQGKEQIAGYTDDANLVNDQLLPILIFGDHTRALKYEDEPIALGADGAKALLVNSNLAITRYVYYYLRSIQIKEAGYSRHFKFLKEVKIPIPFKDGIPDFDDQKRVAYLLGKVEWLIAQRKQHLQQLDELVRSVFLEMFGNPVWNEKKWTTTTIGQLIKVASGNGLTAKEMNSEGPYRVYGGNGVNGTHTEYMFEEPMLVIGRVGYYCGSVHITEPQSWVTDNALYIKEFLKDMDLVFLKHLLTAHDLNKVAGKAAQPLVSGARIYPIVTIDVPIEKQRDFSSIVEKVESLKYRYQQSLTDLENLYGALSQQAFKGDLDLSRVLSLKTDNLSDSEQKPQAHRRDDAKQQNNKTDTVKKSEDIAELTPFNTNNFEIFLSARKDEVLTATALWQALQQANFENPPSSFESFKSLLMNYLEGGRWLEQVYEEVAENLDGSDIGKRIALRIRHDS